MQFAAVLVVVAALIMPAGATTDPTEDRPATNTANAAVVEAVFRAFDLFGTWAADCGRPPTPGNPHVSISVSSAGLVFENHEVGPNFMANRYDVLTARRTTADQLEIGVIFMRGTEYEERQTLVMRVRDGTRRTLFNRVGDGPIRVKNGIAVASGRKTPFLKKCG